MNVTILMSVAATAFAMTILGYMLLPIEGIVDPILYALGIMIICWGQVVFMEYRQRQRANVQIREGAL